MKPTGLSRLHRRLAQKIYPAAVSTAAVAAGVGTTNTTTDPTTPPPVGTDANGAMLCFHGMLGTRRTWGAFAPAFAAGGVRHASLDANSSSSVPTAIDGPSIACFSPPVDVVCYDARNHGTSFHDATHSLSAIADDMAAALAEVDAHVGTTRAARSSRRDSSSTPHDHNHQEGSAAKKKKVVLVGHSMCGAALLHFLLRREQRLGFRGRCGGQGNDTHNLVSPPPLSSSADPSLNLKHVELAGAVIVDISPSQRPSTFTTLTRQIARLEQVPLAQMRSTRDVEKWLLSKGPPFPAPEPLTPQALGLGAFPNVDVAAPFPIPGPFLAKYFAANLVQDHGSHPIPMKWGCNLPVLSKAIRDGSISWEGQLPLIQSEVNAPYQHVETPGNPQPPASSPALRRVESVPVHFVFGGDSPYYLEVPSVRGNIERYFARATVDVVPKAGHFVHIERPKAFNESVAAFLGRCGVA